MLVRRLPLLVLFFSIVSSLFLLVPALAFAKNDPALVGNWTLNGQPFLTLKADGTGTMTDDPIKWKSTGTKIVVTGDDETEEIPYTLANDKLTIVAGGISLALAKSGATGKPSKMDAKIAAAAAASKDEPHETAKPAKSGKAGSDQLSQLLMSSPWCSFHYNQVSGTSSSKRYVYHSDGTWTRGGRTETYSNGAGGTFAGQHDSANSGGWKVEGGQLYANGQESGGQWVMIPLSITKNSNGYPIITSNGEEFSQCQ